MSTKASYKVRWIFDSGLWTGMLSTDETGGVPFGRIEVTETGGFKARLEYIGKKRWLSKYEHASFVPFDTLLEAKRALLDEALKEIPLAVN